MWVANNKRQLNNVSKGSTRYLGDKQDFAGPFARNVEIFFMALVVSRSFNTFADLIQTL